MNITLIIPTFNRPRFIVRLLSYYALVGFRGWLFIGDSSDESGRAIARESVIQLSNAINVRYFEYPAMNDSQAIHALLSEVTTPYVAFVADDDFLIPNGLQMSIDFLEAHPDYSIAHGQSFLFVLEQSGAYGNIQTLGRYPLRNLENNSGQERLLRLMEHYMVTVFSVHRTKEYQHAWHNVLQLTDRSFTELLPVCVSAIQGKAKQLDCLYLARQGHDQRYLLPDTFDWITSPNWQKSYLVFRDTLAEEIAKQDGISLMDAQAMVKQAFWLYLSQGLTHKWRSRYAPMMTGWKQRAKQITWLYTIWRRARRIVPASSMSLPALLNPASPYYADFMPIYKIVTEKD